MYSSALEITSIMTCGRNCASIFEIVSSLDAAHNEISLDFRYMKSMSRHPEVAATRPSKDTAEAFGPSPFEAPPDQVGGRASG